MNKQENFVILSFATLFLSTVATVTLAQSTVVNDEAIANSDQSGNWLAYGRTHSEQRFSPLNQITRENVTNLQPDWYFPVPNSRSLVSTPLVVDGVIYFIASLNVVRALDATSGEEIWSFNPQVGQVAPERMRAGWDNSRGISIWENKLFVATWDGRLISLDRTNGEQLWSTQTIDPELAMYVTGAPKAFKGKVLVGNGGTENGPNRGYVTAYDANTGEQAWRFWIVPGNPADGFEDEAMEMAAETWTGEWWRHGGGGNSWHGWTYDAELNQLYIGTGNGSPWNRKIRSPDGGDNLFLDSIVALDPDSGEYLWHHQNTPGETWDYNSNMDIVLADLVIDGETIKALMQAPKNGFFYVINRENGELLSAEKITEVTWASHYDIETARPVELPGVRYETEAIRISPGPIGAHSWHAMSFNPNTGLAYIPSIHSSTIYGDQGIDLEGFEREQWRLNTGVNSMPGGNTRDDAPASLQAWDPIRQEQVWEVLADSNWNAGTLTTATNLLFQGRADGHLLAYDAETGEELWDYDLGLGISAPPITYQIDGKQYLALLVGWGGSMAALGGSAAAEQGWSYGAQERRLVAFSLEGTAVLPRQPPPLIPQPLPSSDFIVNFDLAEQGGQEFNGTCSMCHGGGAIAAGIAPDLRASGIPLSREAFENVVRNGALSDNGMPIYKDLNDEQLESLRHYIRAQAEAALAQ
ncbi:MAG: PQQ-dependent dehydrogenase, methanol/ethanol family [Gammaproteobacteria bacterium]|nr:PQQ-dependent dehydrogenase, methanol/ethanol family [Gammaproteobacteria bacterium]MDD9895508.1 PQQ-dependent dehydrogenase, methanol/ethanol family [Gammaproteobacteria bacterium]MDD9959855.1 PQQ-dependent dehydrogenase, methanol/ethanol family [Gammaproteobacteria bacterium]